METWRRRRTWECSSEPFVLLRGWVIFIIWKICIMTMKYFFICRQINSMSYQSNPSLLYLKKNPFLYQMNFISTQIDWYERVALSKTDVANRTFPTREMQILNYTALCVNRIGGLFCTTDRFSEREYFIVRYFPTFFRPFSRENKYTPRIVRTASGHCGVLELHTLRRIIDVYYFEYIIGFLDR